MAQNSHSSFGIGLQSGQSSFSFLFLNNFVLFFFLPNLAPAPPETFSCSLPTLTPIYPIPRRSSQWWLPGGAIPVIRENSLIPLVMKHYSNLPIITQLHSAVTSRQEGVSSRSTALGTTQKSANLP